MSTIYDMDTQTNYYYDSGYSSSPSPSSSTSSKMMGSPMSQTNENLQFLQLKGHSNIHDLKLPHESNFGYSKQQTKYTPENTEVCLEITEQPMDKFRFRYKSEMHGTHGSLMGCNSSKSKKTYPTVALRNFKGTALVRCSLYQVDSDKHPLPHSHRLVVRKNDEDIPDPHELILKPPDKYTANFQGMGIIHTAKKFISEELFLKRVSIKEFYTGELTMKERIQLKIECEKQSKQMNLNQVVLRFEAFEKHSNGQFSELCDPVYSRPINNMKSALTGELKISRLSACVSSAAGGDDLFLLVEKVGKKNIRVKFFQMDDDDETVWEAYGEFNEADVHHQYAIALRTPPYKNKDIEKHVDVYIQLVRPSDGDLSEPVPFKYKPRDCVSSRKRARTCSSSGYGSAELPKPLDQYNQTISEEFGKDIVINDFLGYTSQRSEELEETFREADLFDELESDSVEKSIQPQMPTNYIKKDDQSNKDYAKDIYNYLRQIDQIKEGNDNISKTIKKIYLDANARDEDILHNIIQHNEITDAIKLLSIIDKWKIYDVLQLKNEDGNSCLHIACMNDRSEYIRSLINLGTDVNIQNNKGNTALHIVAAENFPMCLSKILERENYTKLSVTLNANLSNDEGLTPLHIAIRNRNLSMVKRLLEFGGASTKIAASKDGNNALHTAVEMRDEEIVKYLVNTTTVRLDQKNIAGFTPLELADSMGMSAENILQILRAHGAIIDLELEITKKDDKMDDTDDESSSEEDEKVDIANIEIKDDKNCSKIQQLNKKTCLDLSKIIEKNNIWRVIAKKMNLTTYLNTWNRPSSMLNLINISQKVDHFMEILQELHLEEAIDCIEKNVQ